MPTLKNRTFHPLGLLLRDHSMLHIAARDVTEVAASELDGPHLKAMLDSDQLVLLSPEAPPAAEPVPAPRSRPPKG